MWNDWTSPVAACAIANGPAALAVMSTAGDGDEFAALNVDMALEAVEPASATIKIANLGGSWDDLFRSNRNNSS